MPLAISSSNTNIGPMGMFQRVRFGKNVSVMLICLLLAVLFWFLKTFTKDYGTVIELPVSYSGISSDQVVLNDLPEVMRVQVNAWGFTLLRHYAGAGADTITIPCDQLKDTRLGAAYLSTKPLLGEVAAQFSDGIRVERLLTDSIYFRLDKRVNKMLPVEARVNATFAPQYLQSGPLELLPAAIAVSGPASIMDTLEVLRTEVMDFPNLEKSTTAAVGFVVAQENSRVECRPPKLLLTVPVDRFTERTVSVPVTVANVPDSLLVQTFPKAVDVTFRVAYSEYKRVNPSTILAEVDFDDSDNLSAARLNVRMDRIPDFVDVVRFSPKKVEYRIKKL